MADALVMDWSAEIKNLNGWSFGDNPQMADELFSKYCIFTDSDLVLFRAA
jgi:hypothetical protein